MKISLKCRCGAEAVFEDTREKTMFVASIVKTPQQDSNAALPGESDSVTWVDFKHREWLEQHKDCPSSDGLRPMTVDDTKKERVADPPEREKCHHCKKTILPDGCLVVGMQSGPTFHGECYDEWNEAQEAEKKSQWPPCKVCGDPVGGGDPYNRVANGGVVHKTCGQYGWTCLTCEGLNLDQEAKSCDECGKDRIHE
jgi:hypothetical protein